MPRLKGPVPQVQAKEGLMPQLVKKRRSGWAVLAMGALVASILTVGATPAVATVREADVQATWTACLGSATDAGDFTDVSMTSVHYKNINCLAYYEITVGKTADTFDPRSSVTRSQMALFLARAASVAGVDLGEVMDEGFTDIDMVSAEKRSAINRLASEGIMEGRTATTFEPYGLVTRADMAVHIFTFLDLALDSVYIDELPSSVDGDGTGHIELDSTDNDVRDGDPVDDYFGDARRTLPAHVDDMIGAIYELGVTTGTNNRVGDRGTFEPEADVTRAQMASFIMRALGHTNLRPKGLTAQQTYTETRVSMRDADFKPVVNARVEVFRSHFAASAFNRAGQCLDRFVIGSDPSFEACEIDSGDDRTDIDGNADFQPGLLGGRPVITCAAGTAYANETDPTYRLEALGVDDPEAEYKLWAWTGSFGDAVDDDTELFEAVPANFPDRRTRAVTALFSGGTSHPNAKMGSALIYEIQLVDFRGRPVGPNPVGDVDSAQDYIVTVEKQKLASDGVTPLGQALRTVTPMTPDSDGNIKIVVTNPDSVIGQDDPDVRVRVTVKRADRNKLRFVDLTAAIDAWDSGLDTADTGMALDDGDLFRETETRADGESHPAYDEPRIVGATAPQEIFSDDTPVATRSALAARETWRELSNLNRNTVSVTVLDQYGNPFKTGTSITATFSSRSAETDGTGTIDRTSDRGGRIHFSYNYGGRSDAASTETVTLDGPAAVATVHWAEVSRLSEGTARVLLADARGQAIIIEVVVDAQSLPAAYLFGGDDEFLVGGIGNNLQTLLSLEQFLEVLMVASSPDPRISFDYADEDTAVEAMLDWSGFNIRRPTDSATFELKGLTCTPPPGADREPALADRETN